MNICKRCIMPDTRPDTPFIDGVCQACLNYENRPKVDWDKRADELHSLLRAHKNDSGYDCIIPSSGGKDSHYQVFKVIELGFKPLVVTASTCYLTPMIGRRNIENLKRYADAIEISPDTQLRRQMNVAGQKLVGDISWPEHVLIFTVPFHVSQHTGIDLILYGENPQNQYGGPEGEEQAKEMTSRWRSEFGGFLGLRPSDMAAVIGAQPRDMFWYEMPKQMRPETQAHFLGQYLPWDSWHNADVARGMGMEWGLPFTGNWWQFENLDNAMTGLHDYGMWRKYGYRRGTTQMSVDIRTGRISRNWALQAENRQRSLGMPLLYAGVALDEVLRHLRLSRQELIKSFDDHTNWELMLRVVDDAEPILVG